MSSQLQQIRRYPRARYVGLNIKDDYINKDLLGIMTENKISYEAVAKQMSIAGNTVSKYLRTVHLNKELRKEFIDAIEAAIENEYGYIYRIPDSILNLAEADPPIDPQEKSIPQEKGEIGPELLACMEEIRDTLKSLKQMWE